MRCNKHMKLTETERFWCKVSTPRFHDECWNWQGGKNTSGYGEFRSAAGPMVRAHRLAYEWQIGAIPEGYDLHHTCENRLCVNPAHLMPVTKRDHTALFNQNCPSFFRRQQTHCVHGHEFTPENTRRNRFGYRQCRECARKQLETYRRKAKAA